MFPSAEGGPLRSLSEGELPVLSELPGTGKPAAKTGTVQGALAAGLFKPSLSGELWTGSAQPRRWQPAGPGPAPGQVDDHGQMSSNSSSPGCC